MNIHPIYTLLIVIAGSIFLFSCNTDIQKDEPAVPTSTEQKVTIQDVESGIRKNIEEETQQGNGYFSIETDSMKLQLKLVRVHTEYLSVLGKNRFFACVDLATEDGDVYDVDFFMDGTADEMQVTRTDVHKLNGKPYYTWKQAEDKTWFTVPITDASNKLLGIIEGRDQFSFSYQITVPSLSGNAKIWVPIAQSDEYQSIDVTSITSPGKQNRIRDKIYNNDILYIELTPEDSGEIISINYAVERKEKAPYEGMEEDLEIYLGATPYLPVGDRFKTIADEVIQKKEAKTPLTKARALYDYVIDEVKYAKQGVYGTGDANYACDSKSGNCTEFHSLFISLARSAGIPARFAVGAAIPSSRNDGGVDGYHCWAEFHADGKWWPIDISEADKYSALSTYYFGHHPANRIEFSKGREISPAPMPDSGPINFLAYPVFEVEGEVDLIKTTFSFQRVE